MKKNRRLWLPGLYVLQTLLCLAPVAVVVGLDWNVYTATPARSVSLSLVGVLAVGLVVLTTLGKTPKNVRRVVWYGVAAGVLWVVRPIVANIAMLVSALAVGELLAELVAKPLIAKEKRERACAPTVKALNEVVDELRGRV